MYTQENEAHFGLEKRPTTEHAQTCATPTTSREAQLLLKIQQLQQLLSQQSRISELEKQVQQSSALSPSFLESQVEDVLSAHISAYHGPNTTPHFHEFSVDLLVFEYKEHVPDVWQLINTLGNFADDDQQAIAESRVASILLCILKCRSQISSAAYHPRQGNKLQGEYLQCICVCTKIMSCTYKIRQ